MCCPHILGLFNDRRAFSAAKEMLADLDDDRAGADPLIRRGDRVIVIDCAAGGIPAVERVLCGAVAAFRYRLIELPVVQAGEGAFLINHAGNGIGKRRVFHPVEHDRAYRNLAGIRFPAGFSRYQPRKQVVIALAVFSAACP